MFTIPFEENFRAYARHGDETAFQRLVEDYAGLVRGAALRSLQEYAHLAEDVTQAVFVRLAQKAPTLPEDVCLPAWLHQHAVWMARDLMRRELRRRQREISAAVMNEEELAPEEVDDAQFPVHQQLREVLDTLRAQDREALILRFFRDMGFREVGAALGIPADTARKRVERALRKLRERLEWFANRPPGPIVISVVRIMEGLPCRPLAARRTSDQCRKIRSSPPRTATSEEATGGDWLTLGHWGRTLLHSFSYQRGKHALIFHPP